MQEKLRYPPLLRISGSDQCRTRRIRDHPITRMTKSSKDDDTLSNVDRVLDQDQEFWLQAATNDFEKENRASGDEISIYPGKCGKSILAEDNQARDAESKT